MDDLISDIETFCRAHGMPEYRFGLEAVNDRRLVPDIRAGRELRRATIERVRTFMLTYVEKQAA